MLVWSRSRWTVRVACLSGLEADWRVYCGREVIKICMDWSDGWMGVLFLVICGSGGGSGGMDDVAFDKYTYLYLPTGTYRYLTLKLRARYGWYTARCSCSYLTVYMYICLLYLSVVE